MKVLAVLNFSKARGTERQFAELAHALAGEVTFDVVLRQEDGLTPWYREAIGPYVDQTFVYKDRAHAAFDYARLAKQLRYASYDAIHAFLPGGSDVPRWLRAATCPVILTIVCAQVCPWPAHLLAAVVVPSEFVKSLQPEAMQRVAQVIPLGLGPDETPRGRLREALGVDRETLLVGRLSSISPVKRVDHFFDVADRLHDVSGVVWVCAGLTEGMIEYELRLNARAGTRVHVLRALTEQDKRSFWRDLDIALLPTTQEAFGMIFLEAMRAGCAVVTYDDGANAEVVGTAGLLVPVDDIDQLTDATRSLLTDGALRTDKQHAATARWHETFQAERYAQRLRALYAEVVSGETPVALGDGGNGAGG